MKEQDTAYLEEFYRSIAPAVIKGLQRRNYQVYYCETAEKALETVLSLIPVGSSVSWGGSETLKEIGIIEALKNGDYHAVDRDSAATEEERFSKMREAFLCDTYLSSVNAVSENGTMFNIDGTGNRIAAIAFGPKSVILVVGMNKVCRTPAEARDRARHYAAPKNGKRQGFHLPCVKAGSCQDCYLPESMCSQIVEMRRNRVTGRIKVILVGKKLGF